jgi:hypothetical protein
MKDNYFYNNDGKLEKFIKINAVSIVETTLSLTAKLNYNFEKEQISQPVLSKVMYFEFWNDPVYQHFPDKTILTSNN